MENTVICFAKVPKLSPKQLSAAGQELAWKALSILTKTSAEDLSARGILFSHKESGQPVFLHSRFFVSITHTKGAVAAAVSLFPVGIDLEASKRESEKAAQRIFSENQFQWYQENKVQQKNLFASLWTLHEAYAKWTGLGLAKMPEVLFTMQKNQILCSDHRCKAKLFCPIFGFTMAFCTCISCDTPAEIKEIAFF